MLGAVAAAVKAVLGAVWRVVFLGVKIVYAALKFLHIRLLALYVAVCGVLAIFIPVFEGEGLKYFWVGFACFSAATLFMWIAAARRRLRSRPRQARGGEEKTEEKAENPPPAPSYPRFYDVEGRPAYFFAEYEDRYELFYRSEKGIVYVRTDYKRNINGA